MGPVHDGGNSEIAAKYVYLIRKEARMLITATEKAIEELRRRTALGGEGALGVRLSVTNTGCSGHAYNMEHVYEENDADERLELSAGNGDRAVLYVPKKDLLALMGTEIDFQEDKFASAFVYRNPNATAQCGCGESFKL